MDHDCESAIRHLMTGAPPARHAAPTDASPRNVLHGLWCALGTLVEQVGHSMLYTPDGDEEAATCSRFN